ncbi:FH2 domain-containing protein 1 [Oryzias melastigma]|uniref:FH2 domain-containing protein 1 n=1 Tax=Oryzias melastigma TaxID=30732 RepID=A0A834C9U7_ORYME|nr:FH2 domain-containing protein 1 [Oryzias melastigma]
MHVMDSVFQGDQSEGFPLQQREVAVAVVMPSSSPTGFYDNRNVPAPPPPAPPLPPPPPPPPGGPGIGLKKKKRVRSFFWKTIPAEQVKGRANVWTQDEVQQSFQIDVQKIEELFCQNERQGDAKPGRTKSQLRETKEQVTILDPKRGMNVGIFLKQFKRSNQAIIDDIRHGNSEAFGAEPVRELLKLLPETEEVKKLTAFRGDASQLPLADAFMYLLIQVPSYSIRIESILLKEEFPGSCDAMKRDIATLRSATKELMSCKELHAVLHLVLQAGNILNAGGYAGNALGFKLSSLLSLADTKANKPGMNLLHFVAQEARKTDEKLLEFPHKLRNVQAASRISLLTLDDELQLLTSRTRSLEENVQRDTELLQQLDSFLQSATSSLCSLRAGRQQLKKEGNDLIDFFCEDIDSFKLDDCFSIFHTFCLRFTNAVKENGEREAKEAARRQHTQEVDELKRHSWAGGEQARGAFGMRCSSEADMSAATLLQTETKQLLGLLSPKSHPRSLHNASVDRAGSLRRTRNSPSNLPFVLAERELSTLLEMGLNPKGSQQRGLRGCKSPEQRTRPSSPRVTPASPPPTPSGASETSGSPEKTNHAASPLFNKTHVNPPVVSEKVELTLTSNLNQQPDHKNHEDDQGSKEDLSQQKTLTTLRSNATRTKTEDEGSNTEDMCVVLEKCTLVPELKAFEQVAVVTGAKSDAPHLLKDVVITDLEDEGADQPERVETTTTSQREEKEDKVIVWCVTGVCDVVGEKSSTLLEDRHNGRSSATDNSSDLQLPNQGSVAPVSSQPLPASRSDNGVPASFLGASPPELVPKGVSEEDESTSKKSNVSEQSKDDGKSKRDSRSSSEVPSNNKKAPTKASTKDISASKVRHTKPTTSNSSSAADKSKPVRTLTRSENQGMRRVVPISRTSQSSSFSIKVPVRPLQTPIRERPPTAASLRRSNKIPESRDSKVSGSRNQNQDFERKPSVRKPLTKPSAQAEEKICRSTLRVLTQGGRGGTVSAPTTPLHKTGSPSVQPGFTRSTASSSFRKTHSTLGSSSCSQPSRVSPLKTPTKNTPSPSPSVAASSGSTRTVSPKLLDPAGSSSTPTLKRNLTIRSSTRSPLHALTPHQGHRRNNSGSSTHSRDSGKSSRPNWR